MDTYRFWEAVFVGSVPIVKRESIVPAPWFQGLEPFPYLIVNNWNEINENTIRNFEQKWTQRIQEKGIEGLNWDYLFSEYWYGRFQSHRLAIEQ